jgi:hypothetical protein
LSISRSAHSVGDNIDFCDITREQVYIGFVLRLPFRLRLGRLYRHSFQMRGSSFELMLRNRYLIPPGTQHHEIVGKIASYDVLWTEALIIVNHLARSIRKGARREEL